MPPPQEQAYGAAQNPQPKKDQEPESAAREARELPQAADSAAPP
jgi:hypothetical protein